MSKSNRIRVLDKLHLWSVRALMGITLAGCATLTMQVYTYYNYIRPERLAERRKEKELEMAMEQEEREAELRRRQKDAETLVG